MEVERKIFGNTLLLVTGQLIAQVANFGFVILVARVFGASTLGLYSLAMAVGALSGIFVTLGTNTLARKDIAREPPIDCAVIGTILPLQILTGAAVWSTLVVLSLLFMEDRTAATFIIVVGLFHVISRWQFLLLTRFQARQSMRFVAIMQASTRLGILCLSGLAIYLAYGAVAVLLSLPFTVAVLLLLTYFYGVREYGVPNFKLRAEEIGATIRRAWPYMSILVLAVLYERLGIIFLRAFQSDEVVGYFASAERLLVPFSSTVAVFIAAVAPALMAFSRDDGNGRESLGLRFLRVLLVLAFPAATLVYLYRADIILLLYGADFQEAIAVLAIMSWVIALRGFNAFLAMFSISSDLQTRLTLLKLISLLLFVLLCVLLIPRYSYLGLAYSIVAADLFLAVVMSWSLRREQLLPGLLNILWRPVVSCAITVLVTMNFASLTFPGRFALSLTVLVASAFLTGAVRRHDLGFLLRIANEPRLPDTR